MTLTSALIDIGGSSVKVTIRDLTTNEIYSAELSIEAVVEGEHIYVNPEPLYKSVVSAMNECTAKFSEKVRVDRILVSTLRQGFCLINNSKEITPIFLNSDISGILAKEEITDYGSERIYSETGHWFAPQLTLPKLINLFRKHPELNQESTKLLFVHDWLVWRFTREQITEMSLVSAGQMANLKERKTHNQLLQHFGFSEKLIPTPVTFGSEITKLNSNVLEDLSRAWDSAVLCVGGGDSHFLHFGASANMSGTLVVSAGSSTPVSLLSENLGKSTLSKPWKSTSFDPEKYLLEGNLGYPGTFYGWLKNNASGSFSTPNLDMASILRAPRVFGSCRTWSEETWESRPAFSILGDFKNSTSTDLELGLILDYAFALNNQILEFTADKFNIQQIVITGGGGNSLIQQIVRNLTDIPVRLISQGTTVSNVFSLLEDGDYSEIDKGKDAELLDLEIIQLLQKVESDHAMLYSELEGTRRVLQNVR